MVIKWTFEVRVKLRNIFDYYNFVAGRNTAKGIISDLKNSVKSLIRFPEMYPRELSLEEFQEDFRYIVVRHIFKVIYFIDKQKDTIVVVTIFDCRQNPDKLKNEAMNYLQN